MKKRLIVTLAVLLVLVGTGAAALYAYDSSRSDVIAQGVRVAGFDVGGMRDDKVRAELRRRLLPRLERPMKVTFQGQTFVLDSSATHVRVDVGTMVQTAVDESRRDPFTSRIYRELTGGQVQASVPLHVAYSTRAVTLFVRRIAKSIDREPTDAKVVPSLTAIGTVPSHDGIAVRRASLRHAIQAQLVRPNAPHAVAVATRVVKPKVSTGQLPTKYPYFITIDRGAKQLRLFEHLRVAKVYTIAVGRQGLETPAGLYQVEDKQVDPWWHVPNSAWAGALAGRDIPPGPEDPLKARWMGFYDGSGIHGTDDVASLGTAASHGCIRMSIPDVIELFDIVPLYTPLYIA